MNKEAFTLVEWFYWVVRVIFIAIATPPGAIANWATDRLNKSYYRNLKDIDAQLNKEETDGNSK